jgi:hypothetical protein
MRAPQELQVTVVCEPVKIREDRVFVQAQVCLELPMPAHDADLPGRLEASVERGGQLLKRRLFQQVVEHADAALVLAHRDGKHGQGIVCRGTTAFTFKTVFGTVKVRRRRVEHRSDGRTEVPSAHAWQTPRQVALTPGLRHAACDGMLRDSAQQTVAGIDARADERGVLAKATVLKVVHDEGQRLQAAAHARAASVYARDPAALRVFVPPTPRTEPAPDPAEPGDGQDEPREEITVALVGFGGEPGGPAEVERGQPRQVDPGVALVELDEVKVHAQARTGHKEVLVFTALVMIADRCWHLAAATTRELTYQVGALLGVLEVHRDTCSLLVLADGARWIRDWFEGVGVRGGTMIVCWYHVVKRCQQDLSRACRGREHRGEVEAAVLKALWHGRVEEAIAVLRCRSAEMRNVKVLEDLIGYLELRRRYLPDYEARQRAGLWIASNRVEKFNDWSVSARCKHQGMEWTDGGVVALAALEAARRNGELSVWRTEHHLLPWKVGKGHDKAA